MSNTLGTIGIIGGTGWMGSAIIKQMLMKQFIAPHTLWVSNRSGQAPAFAQWPDIHVTANNQQLLDHCDTILLSVRPQQLPALSLNLNRHLVLSVMAGVTVQRLIDLTGASRVVRTMPNAAAEIGLSYTPWFATANIDAAILSDVQTLLTTFGEADHVHQEDHVDFLTALTGSGQGWVAYFESCLIETAVQHGLPPTMAERAIRQLFLGMGTLLHQSQESIEHIVKVLIDYAGTTAAGLRQMQQTHLAEAIQRGILASYEKAKSDMTK